MNEEREMILRMLKEGKISVEEADALLQALEDAGSDAGRSPDAQAGPPPGAPDIRTELRGIFDDLVESIPKDVMRELKRTREALQPSFWGALHALRGLNEGQAESAAEEPMAAGERLVVHNAWGDVRITNSLGPLRVKARRRIWAAEADEAQRLAQSLEVTPQRGAGEVRVEVPWAVGRRARVDLDLEVPAGVAVAVRLAKGDVRASDLSGPLEVDVTRGEIQVAHLTNSAHLNLTSGDVDIQSVSGDVSLDVRSGDIKMADVAGAITGRVLNGDIQLTRCGSVSLDVINGDVALDQVTGDVSVDAKNGDFSFSNLQGHAVRGRTISGDAQVSMTTLPDDAKVLVEVTSGDIRLSLPAPTHATIDATVQAGEIDCAMPLLNRTGDRRGLRGTLNAPGAMITLRALRGDIDIRTIP